jgi:hypothetical protein
MCSPVVVVANPQRFNNPGAAAGYDPFLPWFFCVAERDVLSCTVLSLPALCALSSPPLPSVAMLRFPGATRMVLLCCVRFSAGAGAGAGPASELGAAAASTSKRCFRSWFAKSLATTAAFRKSCCCVSAFVQPVCSETLRCAYCYRGRCACCSILSRCTVLGCLSTALLLLVVSCR